MKVFIKILYTIKVRKIMNVRKGVDAMNTALLSLKEYRDT